MKQEIKLEEVFNDDKKENIKKFINEINNPAEPNQALKDAAERLKGKELFKESNDRARKILSEIKSLPIQERYEKYSERFDNDESAIGNPETWGKRVLTEEDIFNQRDINAVTDYIGKETSKQETLEEAAERILANNIDGLRDALKDDDLFFFYKGVVQCYGEAMAKCQQEQIGKSEFLQKLRATLSDAEARRLIFETFKKK
jgi:hypothetical protein